MISRTTNLRKTVLKNRDCELTAPLAPPAQVPPLPNSRFQIPDSKLQVLQKHFGLLVNFEIGDEFLKARQIPLVRFLRRHERDHAIAVL